MYPLVALCTEIEGRNENVGSYVHEDTRLSMKFSRLASFYVFFQRDELGEVEI